MELFIVLVGGVMLGFALAFLLILAREPVPDPKRANIETRLAFDRPPASIRPEPADQFVPPRRAAPSMSRQSQPIWEQIPPRKVRAIGGPNLQKRKK